MTHKAKGQVRPIRINVRAAALKTRIILQKYASFAGIFLQNNTQFWGPAAPKPLQ
jgi:hypothetical protein